ncbi:MAG: hypothetical protein ACTSU6_06715, partial [Candidatus Njordarchaeales archaeon]
IEEREGGAVYNIGIPKYHNFVCGYGGFISHNSHHDMGTSWSSIDEEFITEFSKPRKITVFILSSKGEHNVRVEIRDPFFISIDNLEYQVEEDAKLAKFLKREIKKKIRKPEPIYYIDSSSYFNEEEQSKAKRLNEEIGKRIKFFHKVNKVKIVDIHYFLAEAICEEFGDYGPTLTSQDVEHAEVTFKFKNKTEAVNFIREVKDFIKLLLNNIIVEEEARRMLGE